MTEASPIVFLSNADESEHKSLTTVGQVLDHSEVSFTRKIRLDNNITNYLSAIVDLQIFLVHLETSVRVGKKYVV